MLFKRGVFISTKEERKRLRLEKKKKKLLEEFKKSLPQLEGTIKVEGLKKEVKVIRDKWGIPHIFAENDHDLFFTQGYIHAQDRLWQIIFFRFVTSGRMSEFFGKILLDFDIFMRTLGLERVAKKEVEYLEKNLDKGLKDLVNAYIAGVNAYIDANLDNLPPEFSFINHKPEPFSLLDIIRFGKYMIFSLNGNMNLELLRAEVVAKLGEKRAKQIMPFIEGTSTTIVPSSGAYTYYTDFRDKYKDIFPWIGTLGSNNWVVNGSKTTTGKPLLANDPHLPIMIPAIWYENHLVSKNMNLYGVSLPGNPGIIIGFNGNIAWGLTVFPCDVEDWFIEKMNPKNPHQYEYNGKWVDAEIMKEKFLILNDEAVEKEIIITKHGPVFDFMMIGRSLPFEYKKIDKKLALRWTGHEPSNVLQGFLGVNKAKDWKQFRAALKKFGYASQNFIYADIEGNIGYQIHGHIPIRKKGSGILPVPGWTDEYEWIGYIPFEELPSLYNPSTNFIVTANNKTVDDDYPYHITHDWYPDYRARRVTELITAKEKLSIEDFKTIQGDDVSIHARETLPLMLQMKPANELQKKAISLLKNWNFSLSKESTAAAIFEMWYHYLLINLLKEILGDELFDDYYIKRSQGNYESLVIPHLLRYPEKFWFRGDSNSNAENLAQILTKSLQAALDKLKEMLGEDMKSWAWGKIHSASFSHPLGLFPPNDLVMNVMWVPTSGDANTINNGSFDPAMDPERGFKHLTLPSTRIIVDFNDFSNSINMHTTGQSGHPASEHYSDMCYPWSNIEYHPIIYDKKLIEKEADKELKLVPK